MGISSSSSSHSSSTAAAQGLGFRLQTVGVRVQCLLWLTEAVKSLDKADVLLHEARTLLQHHATHCDTFSKSQCPTKFPIHYCWYGGYVWGYFRYGGYHDRDMSSLTEQDFYLRNKSSTFGMEGTMIGTCHPLRNKTSTYGTSLLLSVWRVSW